MAGNEEGIYASSKSIDCGTNKIDHGLTLHPKTKSRDASHSNNAHKFISGALKDAFLPLHSSGPHNDTDRSWSNPVVIDVKSELKDLYPAKRRRFDTYNLSSTSQVEGSGFEAGTRLRPWSILSLESSSNAADRNFLTGEDIIPSDTSLASHVSAPPSYGHDHACQEVFHNHYLFDDGASRLVQEIDINKETSPADGLVPTADGSIYASSVSDHVVLVRSKQNLGSSYQISHHAAKDVEQKEGEAHAFGFGSCSGVNSRYLNVPVRLVEKDPHELETAASNDKSIQKSLSSRCSRAATVAYGVSSGLFEGHLRKPKPDPFWSANEMLQNPSTQHDSPQTRPVLPQTSSVAARVLKFQQSSNLIIDRNPSQGHVIPSDLRVQFDALVKKYHQDALFRRSVDTYMMEKSGLPQSPANGAAEMMEGPALDPLDGKSLPEIKSMYKALEERFERLRQLTKEMSKDRLHDQNEIKYLKSVAQKIPQRLEGKADGPPRAKKPSDEMWVCQLPVKSRKLCGRKNPFYKHVGVWVKKKSCSSCHGYINNVREGFEYDRLANMIDSYDVSLEKDDESEAVSHPSALPQQGAPDNATFPSLINSQGNVEKAVPETTPKKRKASDNAPSKTAPPKKRVSKADRQMVKGANDILDVLSGRQRKSWEGLAKYANSKKRIEISSDSESGSESNSEGGYLTELDSIFGPEEEHEAAEVATMENRDKNIMDGEDDLEDLEDALRAALESDESIYSQEQAYRRDGACDHSVTEPPSAPVDYCVPDEVEDLNKLKTNRLFGSFQKKVVTAAEESDESEEE